MNNLGNKNSIPGKKPSHRRAVIRSLLLELIRHERLQTTPTKAKILKREFDKLVTEAKKETDASKRRVLNKLQSELATTKLHSTLLPRLSDVNSGYTYSAHTLPRKGDNAPQMIVLVRGAEIKERKSKLAAALARREQADEGQGVVSRIRGSVRGGRGVGKREAKKHESAAEIRRVST